MTTDIKDIYYGTPMQEHEHGHLPIELIPQDIMTQCSLDKFASKDKVYVEIQKEIPRLKQAGIIPHNRLSEHLMNHNHILCRFASSLWMHKNLPISFTIVVDYLGIKQIKKRQQKIHKMH